MKIIFSHGKESGPWGTKITALASVAKSLGYTVESIDYTGTHDADKRVTILQSALTQEALTQNDVILVGSSMGGYVSAVVAQTVAIRGLFLMAPALYMPGYDKHTYDSITCPVTVVHGWHDDIIPYQHSIRFAQEHNATLILLDADHGLNSALPDIENQFRLFLSTFA